ncbi:Rieske (2Fe-2S) protein [Thermogutta sp.]|uniref:Rieske (2Fe-2S) protein n=1 Tax=Thermogutta sp. TaxID=1962930 RepID=UPI00321FB16F
MIEKTLNWHDEQWWRAVELSSLKEGEGFLFSADGHEIALFRVGEEVFAVDNYCPHMGDSLSAGEIYQGAVICPRHMWAFRLTDGQCLDVASLRARIYQVAIRDGWVYVKKPTDPEDTQSKSKQ